MKKLQERQLGTGTRGTKRNASKIPLDATWAFYSNVDAAAVNMHLVHKSAQAEAEGVFRLTAEIRNTKKRNTALLNVVDDPALVPPLMGDGINPKGYKMSQAHMSHLDIFYGCKLRIRNGNAGNEGGVANGSEGYFLDTVPPLDTLVTGTENVQLPNGDNVTVKTLSRLPDHLLILVPDATVSYGNMPAGIVPIPMTNRNFFVHGRTGKRWVRQFNVRHCHAYTVHSLQGLEAENGLVVGCLSKQTLNHIYVLLSRIRTWTKLYILPHLKITAGSLTVTNRDGNYGPYLKLKQEMERLSNMAEATKKQYDDAKRRKIDML